MNALEVISDALVYGSIALLVFLFIGNFFVSTFVARSRKGTSGRVVGIVGRMGSGKSYAAVRLAEDRMKRGVNVVTNFEMKLETDKYPGQWAPFTGWDQFSLLRDCVVIIDEAHMFASSHQSLKLPMIARYGLAHARKRGLDVFWIAQHEDRVNKALRELTSSMMVTEAYLGARFFRVKEYDPEDFRKKKSRAISKRWYRRRDDISALYETSEAILVDEYTLDGDRSAAAVRRAQRSQREDGLRAVN